MLDLSYDGVISGMIICISLCHCSLITDAALRQAISMKNSGEIESLASSKLCTIHVPQYNKSCAVELVTECSIFLCDGSDSCVVKSLVFVQPLDVLITEEKSAREEVVKLVCSLSAKSN